MRKIEKAMCNAVAAGRNWRCGNTEVLTGTTVGGLPGAEVRLHGNCIAKIAVPPCQPPRCHFTLAGWPTPTTRSRLNALLLEFVEAPAWVYQERGKQYLLVRNGVIGDVREIGEYEWFELEGEEQ